MDGSSDYGTIRQLEKRFDWSMIAAAFVVSFLGSFTATQVMIQARTSSKFSSALTWIVIVSLTFGFCASWSLHFVGMLSCSLDLPIELDAGITLLSAALAVLFTFIALGSDILWTIYHGGNPGKTSRSGANTDDISIPLLQTLVMRESGSSEVIHNGGHTGEQHHAGGSWTDHPDSAVQGEAHLPASPRELLDGRDVSGHIASASAQVDGIRFSNESGEQSQASASASQHWSLGGSRIDDLTAMAAQGNEQGENALVSTYQGVVGGFSWKAISMGLVWSASLTLMHYFGLMAMRIPEGYMRLSPVLVTISALISWAVCIVGYIYMINITSFLSQQILFSSVAAFGISSFHFTGLYAATFWSRQPPTESRTWPVRLPIAIWSIAILTCMLANGLLAQTAILSRNKLAEIVLTRKKLWRAMAEKENAEAAAIARGTFIASASHEIRTPLHQLQGYTDLLSRSDLSDTDRQHLSAIQAATRTLSLITNNVLDWSKLDSGMEMHCRLVAVDIRAAAESVILMHPGNDDDESFVDTILAIAPNVPKTLMLDETYIHRVLMNLLSNALKFTTTGYVMLTVEMHGYDLVIKVIDTGLGIPRQFIPHLFEPFSQAETVGSQRGTGLGLSIVQQLVCKMGGRIDVCSRHAEQGYSRTETGTTFTLVIPNQANTPTMVPAYLEPPSKALNAAILPGGCPLLRRGIIASWELFGYKVHDIDHHSELTRLPAVDLIWADPQHLQRLPECLVYLERQWDSTVLVPDHVRHSFTHLKDLAKNDRFVIVSFPLVWHKLVDCLPSTGRIASVVGTAANTGKIRVQEPIGISIQKATQSKGVVLLVEDNTINQKLGRKMLSALGYTVLTATDGNEAISVAMKHDAQIDVILMDQSMPNKDGITATRELRNMERSMRLLRRHVIIALTAVVDSASRVHFLEAGADDFLSKPLTLGQMDEALTAYVVAGSEWTLDAYPG